MTPARRAALEKAGFRVGDAAEFVGMTPAEGEMLRLRLAVARQLERLRAKHKLTPKAAAERFGVKATTLTAIESGAPDIPLDDVFPVLFKLGGTVGDLIPAKARKPARPRKKVPA